MSSKRILIVEDDSDTRLAYHILLKVKHYETYFAKDPLSCLWGAHKHRPDLIIMDIGLTAGDGFRAMKQLHDAGHLANIPILVISGGDIQTFKSRAMEFGAQAYFQKPVEQARLMETISRLIGESSDDVSFLDSSNMRRLSEINT
jgi:CheY-like chemotaxis protein